MKINTSRSLVVGAALLSAGILFASSSPVSAQPRPHHNSNGDTSRLDERDDADLRDDQSRDDDSQWDDRDEEGTNDRRDSRHDHISDGRARERHQPQHNGHGPNNGQDFDGPGDSNRNRPPHRGGFGNDDDRFGRPSRGNGDGDFRRPGRGNGDDNFGRPGFRRNGHINGGTNSNAPVFNGGEGYGSHFGQSYTGRVTKVRSNQSFDVEIGGNTFNVYTTSRLPGGLSTGDVVRINGVQKYHNDIRDARVTVVRNR